MGEEMNRREAELNEAALEGVSGGGKNEGFSEAMSKAGRLCDRCLADHPAKEDCEHNHRRDLAQYLLDNGLGSVPVYMQCPYYRQ